jgi:hypothetical protein
MGKKRVHGGVSCAPARGGTSRHEKGRSPTLGSGARTRPLLSKETHDDHDLEGDEVAVEPTPKKAANRRRVCPDCYER